MRLTSRLAGAVVAAALIVVGILLASRPVGDEQLRARATVITSGVVSATHTMWDGSQVLAVTWNTSNIQQVHAQIEDFNGEWKPRNSVDVLFDPDHPTSGAVLAYPYWTFAKDFRADAVFQSVVPFTLAGIILALSVMWPAGPWLFGSKARRARRALRLYVLTPGVACGAVLAVAVVIQDQPLSANSLGADKIVGWLSVALMLLLIWPYVRAMQYYRLRRLLTVPDDAVDATVISSVARRRLELGPVRMVTLAGQSAKQFRTGDRAHLYGRWERRGPTLITCDEKLLIGFAKRPASAPGGVAAPSEVRVQPTGADADVIAEPLIRQYPQLAVKARRYVMTAVSLLLIVVGGSIAIIAIAGRAALGPLWVAWLLSVLLIAIPIRRYSLLSRLLRGPHAARQGVVTAVIRSPRRAAVATIDVPGKRTRRFRAIGREQLSWLSQGQEVVLLELPRASADGVAVLTAPDGHAALAIVSAVAVQDSAAASV